MLAHAYGSTLQPGRWHTLKPAGSARLLIHAASSRALAQLEKRVHANGEQPIRQALFALTLPAGATIPDALERGLPKQWRKRQDATQAFGNAWLDAAEELAIWVPSYVEPSESNLLINARHPRVSQVRVRVERDPFEFDPRLI